MLLTASLLLMACRPPRTPLPSVEDLMEDRVALDGILLKCSDGSARSASQPECATARIAAARLGKDKEAAEIARREQEFERNREQLRQSQERQRALAGETQKEDAYSLPLVPVEPPPASGAR